MTSEQITVSKALLWQAIEAFRWLMPDKKDDNHGGHDARDVREWRRTEAALRNALEQPVVEPCNGWTEAAIAWKVCASVHDKFAKGKDPFYKTRRDDFVRHAENARKNAFTAPQAQQPAVEPIGYLAFRDGKPAWSEECVCEDPVYPVDSDDDRVSVAIFTAPQAQQPAVEPVAVVNESDDGYWADILPDRDVKVGQLLYTAPQAQQPAEVPMLSDEEILQLTPLWLKKHSNGVLIEHARAIESAVRKKAGLK